MHSFPSYAAICQERAARQLSAAPLAIDNLLGDKGIRHKEGTPSEDSPESVSEGSRGAGTVENGYSEKSPALFGGNRRRSVRGSPLG